MREPDFCHCMSAVGTVSLTLSLSPVLSNMNLTQLSCFVSLLLSFLLPPQSELKLPPVLFQSNTFDWIATLACCSSVSLLTAQQIGVPATFQHEPDLVWRFSWNANPLLCNLMICCTNSIPFWLRLHYSVLVCTTKQNPNPMEGF